MNPTPGGLDLEDLEEAAALLDQQGCVLSCNSTWLRSFGRDNFLQQMSRSSALPALQSEVAAYLRQPGERLEWKLEWSGGIWIRARACPTRADSQRVLLRLLQIGTRTELMTENLYAVFKASPLAIVTYTLEGLVSFWSPAAETIYGWSSQERLRRPGPFSPSEALPGTSLVRRQRKDGQFIDVHLTSCRLADGDRPHGVLELAEDVTVRLSQERQRSNRLLLESREAERLSLAREIHDGPLQDLMALGFACAEAQQDLGHVPLEATGAALSGLRASLIQVARRLRSSIHRLRPASLQELGLSRSIEDLIERMNQEARSAPRVRLELSALPELNRVQQLGLYRIVQEAFQNCLCHARASNVTISLRRKHCAAELRVCDDGCGFTPPTALSQLTQREHYGLLGMQERCTLLGGKLSIRSRPQRGTEIRVSLPLGEGERPPKPLTSAPEPAEL